MKFQTWMQNFSQIPEHEKLQLIINQPRKNGWAAEMGDRLIQLQMLCKIPG